VLETVKKHEMELRSTPKSGDVIQEWAKEIRLYGGAYLLDAVPPERLAFVLEFVNTASHFKWFGIARGRWVVGGRLAPREEELRVSQLLGPSGFWVFRQVDGVRKLKPLIDRDRGWS
jgi:hypothetical protein